MGLNVTIRSVSSPQYTECVCPITNAPPQYVCLFMSMGLNVTIQYTECVCPITNATSPRHSSYETLPVIDQCEILYSNTNKAMTSRH